MYLDVSWCIWTVYIKIHAKYYMQDTCTIHRIRILITNVPSPSASPRLLEGGRRNDQDARGRRVTAGGTARAPDELETREAEPRTTADTFIPHVSLINLACIIYHVRIPHVSSNLCRYMYPAWIPHVSRMYPACILHVSHVRSSLQVCLPCNSYRGAQRRWRGRGQLPCISTSSLTWSTWLSDTMSPCQHHDASKIHVSWFCISVYLDVSWWRVQDTCILMYPDMYPEWHQGSA